MFSELNMTQQNMYTARIVIALLLLLLISLFRSKNECNSKVFANQPWTLNDALKVLIPVCAFIWVSFISHEKWSYSKGLWSLINTILFCSLIYYLYRKYIQKTFLLTISDFGINRMRIEALGKCITNIVLIIIVGVLVLVDLYSIKTLQNADISDVMILDLIYLVLIFPLVILVSPTLEELLMRGLLYSPVMKKIGRWKAIISLSIFWSLIHLSNSWDEMFLTFLFSLLLYWSYDRSETLIFPIILHIGLNLFVSCRDVTKVFTLYFADSIIKNLCVLILLIFLMLINRKEVMYCLKKLYCQKTK